VGWVGVVVESRSLYSLHSNILTGGLRPEMAKTDGSSSSLPKPTPFTVYVGSSSSSLPK